MDCLDCRESVTCSDATKSLLRFADEVPDNRTSFGLLKTECHVCDVGLGPDNESVLLLLIAIVFGYLRFQEGSLGFIFGLYVYVRLILKSKRSVGV